MPPPRILVLARGIITTITVVLDGLGLSTKAPIDVACQELILNCRGEKLVPIQYETSSYFQAVTAATEN